MMCAWHVAIAASGYIAGTNLILNRLCDLEKTNFVVVDVNAKSEEIVWRIERQEK